MDRRDSKSLFIKEQWLTKVDRQSEVIQYTNEKLWRKGILSLITCLNMQREWRRWFPQFRIYSLGRRRTTSLRNRQQPTKKCINNLRQWHTLDESVYIHIVDLFRVVVQSKIIIISRYVFMYEIRNWYLFVSAHRSRAE